MSVFINLMCTWRADNSEVGLTLVITLLLWFLWLMEENQLLLYTAQGNLRPANLWGGSLSQIIVAVYDQFRQTRHTVSLEENIAKGIIWNAWVRHYYYHDYCIFDFMTTSYTNPKIHI